MLYGYTGKLVMVDLSNRSFKVLELDEGLARLYIGGKGLANKILYDYGIWGYDPFSPREPPGVLFGAFRWY